jgi:ADP-heptose:LPS heptosyltransferase
MPFVRKILRQGVYIFYIICEIGLCILVPCKKGDRRVLLVRPDRIGDFILFLRVIGYYRMLFPRGEYELSILGNVVWKSLAEWINSEVYEWFDDFIEFNENEYIGNIFYRLKLIYAIRRKGFSTAIYLAYSRKFYIDRLCIYTGAKDLIAADGSEYYINRFKKLNQILRKFVDKRFKKLIWIDRGLPEINKNLIFVEKMFRGTLPDDLKFEFSPESLCFEALENFFDREKLVVRDRYIVVMPGASIKGRQWPAEKFVELIEVARKMDNELDVLLCGSGDEFDLCETIRKSAVSGGLVNLAGRVDVKILLLLLARARCFIGNESGGIHIAASVGTPNICIIGGGHFGRFYPYGDNRINRIVNYKMDCYGCDWKCRYVDGIKDVFPCIAKIELSEVLPVLRTILGER